ALDAGRRFAVEAHLSDNPPLAAQVMGALSQRTALRLLGQDIAPLPAAMLAKATGLYGRGRQLFWQRAATLGGLSLMVATSAFLLTSGGPPAYVGMAVASHRVAMMRADMPSQIEAPA